MTGNGLRAQAHSDHVDLMIDLYCDWRTDCGEVRAAYERFLDAPACDRTTAFAAYVAALDREQSACESYAEQVRVVESLCIAERSRARRRETRDRAH
jgi:hypothetical protein